MKYRTDTVSLQVFLKKTNLKHQKTEFTLTKRFFRSKTFIKMKGVPFDQMKIVLKQAGNGPSPRHIQGSKIAKGLQISKYW